MRRKIQCIPFEPLNPVRFLLYSDQNLIKRLWFKHGKHTAAWRTWRNGMHYIGIFFGSKLVRETLMHNVLHEIGHVICHESNHASHRVSPKLLREVQETLSEKEVSYRQALSELFATFPLLGKVEHMCKSIDIVDILKDFYANDIMIKYSDPEERLEALTEEAEDICQAISPTIEIVDVFFANPFTVLNTVLVSVVSEASAVKLSKQATRLKKKLEQSQNRLDELYEGFPSEASKLRERLVSFFSSLSENPSSSDFMKYISELRDHVLNFYDAYTWWLKRVKDTTRYLSLKA